MLLPSLLLLGFEAGFAPILCSWTLAHSSMLFLDNSSWDPGYVSRDCLARTSALFMVFGLFSCSLGPLETRFACTGMRAPMKLLLAVTKFGDS
jgi:hypothetical protein